jgi:hypothetical protein
LGSPNGARANNSKRECAMSVDAEELELMQRKANAFGLYVNKHRNFDPGRGSAGNLFVMDKRRFPDEQCKTHLSYASAQMVWDFLQLAEESGRK